MIPDPTTTTIHPTTQHNVDHHIDTNTDKDPDLYHYLWFLRDTPTYPWSFFHRFQVARIYCYGVWSFTTAGLLIFEPLNMLVTGSGTRPPTLRLHKSRPFFWFKLVWHVCFFLAMMLALPIWLNWEASPNKAAVIGVRFASFVIYTAITGLLFGMFSQVRAACLPARLPPTLLTVAPQPTHPPTHQPPQNTHTQPHNTR